MKTLGSSSGLGLELYLPVAVAMFLVATTGSDLVARTSIGGETLATAWHEHLYYAGVQFIGTLLLLAPFVAVSVICARAGKQARSRSIAAIFAVAMLTLLYFYFQGYQGSQDALLKERWTAATLSIGLLPFFIGIPVALATFGFVTVAAKFDPRVSDRVG